MLHAEYLLRAKNLLNLQRSLRATILQNRRHEA